MIGVIILVFLPFLLVILGVLFFNVYLRKQITKDTIPMPALDQAYIEIEKTLPEDEEFLGISDDMTENKDKKDNKGK
jgi:hypothetical protein